MSKQILDIPYQESFSDFLTKGETIIWSDIYHTPIRFLFRVHHDKKVAFNKRIGLDYLQILGHIWVLSLLGFCLYSRILPVFGVITLMIFYLIAIWYNNKRSKNHPTQYAITQKRILFQLSHLPKNEIHQIHFSQIKNVIVAENAKNYGTIFLVIKHPEEIPFETYTILDNQEFEKRHQPTLENVENVNTVAELIRNGIRDNA